MPKIENMLFAADLWDDSAYPLTYIRGLASLANTRLYILLRAMSTVERHSSRLRLQFAIALALAFATIVFVAQSLTIAASGVAPLILVQQLVAQVLSIVNDKKIAQPDKQTKLRDLGAANFDFDEMSRLAMASLGVR